ncbi:MAG: hypothetical protein CFE21_14530 [Bacteroidetes bacterium B1(2017)]|nr:MAG: hypothetical protein CFE21_14530 [Bacteroidetes bacterium B1(2017)]
MSRKLLFWAMCLMTFSLYGQPFTFAPKQAFTYVYRLDSAQASLAFKRNVFDTNYFFKHKVDSFYSSIPTLPPGNYLFARFQEPGMYLQQYLVPFGKVRTLAYNGIVQIRVLDSTYNSMPSISLWVDGKQIKRDANCGCFEIPRNKKERSYFLKSDSLFMLGKLSGDYKVHPEDPSSNYTSVPPISHGYFMLNQPKYQPKDSVKLKAFILRSDGIAFTRPMKLFFISHNPYARILLATVKPVSRGAYVYQFKLSDTLKIDQNYELQFQDKDGSILQKANFNIEEYKLRNASYDARIESNFIHAGEKVKFYLSAKDANLLPLTDARVRVRLRLNNYSNFTGKYLFVPNEWRSNMYETNVELEMSSETEVVIPSGVFPPMDMNLSAEISFTNTAGELNQKQIDFNVVQVKSYYVFNYFNGSLNAHFIEDGKIKSAKTILKGYLNGKLLQQDTLMIPAIVNVNAACNYYELCDSIGKMVKQVNVYDMENLVYPDGRRTHDSIFIDLNNPANFEIYYRIYRGQDLIESGLTHKLHFAKVDTSMLSYHLFYSSTILGGQKLQEARYTFKEKELSIKTNLPYDIYPGQNVTVDIKVLNHERIPQEGVNLTAFSVNTQFEELHTPHLTYYGQDPDMILELERTYTQSWPYSTSQFYMQARHTTLLYAGIEHQGDYRLRYPNEILFQAKIPIRFSQAEFTPFVVANGKRVEIYYAEIDGKPRYVKGGSNSEQAFAFLVNPGKHSILLRTKTASFQLPELLFEDSFRYILSFDTLCLPAGITKKVMENHLGFSVEEMEKLKKHLFVFSLNNLQEKFGNILAVQGSTVQQINKPLFASYNPQNASTSNYYGLFQSDSIGIYSNGRLIQNLWFEPNKRYVSFWNQIVSEDLDSLEIPFDFKFFRYQDESFKMLFDTAMRVVDPPKPIGEQKQEVKNRERNKIEEECYFNFKYEPEYLEKNEHTLLSITGVYPSLVRNMVFIHQRNDLRSVLNPIFDAYQNAFNLDLDTGVYSAYFTNEYNALAVFDNLIIPANGAVLLRLDTSDFKHDCKELKKLVPLALQLEESFKIRNTILKSYRKEDYVDIRVKSNLELSGSKEKTPILTGTVFDKYGSALENVIVTLEDRGKVIGISFTDATGGFLIRDIKAGQYQLRFTRYGSCVTIFENVQLSNNHIQTIQARLNDCGFVGNGQDAMPSIFFGKSKITEAEKNVRATEGEPYIAGTGSIRGQIMDKDTKQPLAYVSVTLKLNGVTKAGCLTDEDGNFLFKNLSPGNYDMHVSYVGYKTTIIRAISVESEMDRFVNFTMESSGVTDLREVVVSESMPSYAESNGVNTTVYASKEILARGSRSLNSIAGYSVGVDSRGGEVPTFRGSRADGTAYYIDGVRVQSVGVPSSALDKFEVVVGGLPASNGDADLAPSAFATQQRSRMYEMASAQAANRTRTNFRDYGYWVPNLVTDAKGEAHMNITFPDNITKWRSFILGMDEHFNTKVYVHETRSFKPLSASLYIPSFAINGDAIWVKGKLVNYTPEPIELTTQFELKDSVLQKETIKIKQSQKQKFLVPINSLDTMVLGYTLKTDFNYIDGERFKLPVLPNGIELNELKYFNLNADTTIRFSTDSIGTYSVVVTNNYTQLLRDEIKRLQAYQYGCVEQTTSKLNALLVEIKLCRLLGDSFAQKQMLITCIKRLETLQQSNGSWGWFYRSSSEMWLTHYVLQTLLEAQRMGYKSNSLEKGIRYLKNTMPQLYGADKIRAISILFQSREELDYATLLKPIEENSLDFYDRLLLTSLKQKMALPHFSGFIFEGIQKDKEGSIYWNQPYINIHQNKVSATLLAYEILKADRADSSILAGIRQFFFNDHVFGSNQYRNTLETSLILQAMASDLANQEKGSFQTQLKLNGQALNTLFPKQLTLKPGSSYVIEKQGAKAKMFLVKRYLVGNPIPDSSLFEFQTKLVQDAKVQQALYTDIPFRYEVQLTNLKNQEFIMVQIPIPASCNYLNKNERFGADEVEYHKDRILLFYRKLRTGKFSFSIQLEPRFEGEFTLLPVQVENMYNPEIKGNSASLRISVKEKPTVKN